MVDLVNLLKCADRLKTLGGIEPQGNAYSAVMIVRALEFFLRSPFYIHICTIFYTVPSDLQSARIPSVLS